MKILVSGVDGQLGHDICNYGNTQGHEMIGIDIKDVDITDKEAIKRYIKAADVDAFIHCAAYTAVDHAEDDKEKCFQVNVEGTRNIVEACKENTIKLMYFSTDYVFDGQGEQPWEVNDKPNPINTYGQSKYQGELVVQEHLNDYFIVRITWIYGQNGHNFVKTMLKLSETRDEINVVCDQIGSPTNTEDIAKQSIRMIETDRYGIYHVTNEGYCSWYEFTKEIFRLKGINTKVLPIESKAYPTKAKRPSNSRLSKQALIANGFTLLPDWQDALKRYLEKT